MLLSDQEKEIELRENGAEDYVTYEDRLFYIT
jgi:hypothetical protein